MWGHYSTVRAYLNLHFSQDVQAESLSSYGKLKSNGAVEYITARRRWSLDQHFPQSVSRHDTYTAYPLTQELVGIGDADITMAD